MKSRLKIAGLVVIAALAIVSITRCGSDGGDSGTAVQPLAYTGKIEPVVITTANAPTLVANVLFGGSTVSEIPSAASISKTKVLPAESSAATEHLLAVFHFSLDNILGNATHGYDIPLSLVINDTEYCESGYYTVQGTLDDMTGTGTLTFTYFDCLLEGTTHNGSINFHVHYIDNYRINVTMEFTLLTMISPDFNISLSGTMGIDESIIGNSLNQKITKNYVEEVNNTGRMYKYETFIKTFYVNDLLSLSSSGHISYTGTPAAIMYDSLYGRLSTETIDPLAFSSITLMYPDDAGQVVFSGDNSSIQLSVQSGRHVKLDLDIDGSAGYELVRYVLWGELNDFTGTDLADSDGDGMHDSWETMFGLDPDNNDSDSNLDSDELTNLEEYQQGYDPSDPLSPAL